MKLNPNSLHLISNVYEQNSSAHLKACDAMVYVCLSVLMAAALSLRTGQKRPHLWDPDHLMLDQIVNGSLHSFQNYFCFHGAKFMDACLPDKFVQ